LALLPFLLLLFPDGRALSPRWKWIGWVPIVWLAGYLLFTLALWPHRSARFLEDIDTFGVESLSGIEQVVFTSYTLVMLSIIAALVSSIVRFRRARGIERQQLKWIAFVAALAALNLLIEDLILSQADIDNRFIEVFGETITGPGMFAIAAGLAILRYRLFDIDRIINRALVYGALTALLGLVYVSLVGLAGTFGGDSSITVAGTTLAVAALFQPARRRIQDFIDRRFYRRKYNAARTLDAFSARLRDEIDIDALTDGLVAAVRDTMQPATVSVWLPSEDERQKAPE
jgi:hypothetical protein